MSTSAITTLPTDFLEKVEFDRVIELQVAETLGPGGSSLASKPTLATNAEQLERRLTLAFEMLKSLGASEAPPLRPYEDLSTALRMLEIEGYTMDLEELVEINILLRDSLGIANHFTDLERCERYPNLAREIKAVPPAPELNKEIDKIVDDEGNIRPNASPELARIRRAMQSLQREIDEKFRSILIKYRDQGVLSESQEGLRNGRRVLTAPAQNKRRIKGVVHDQSATGQMVYIEPEEVMMLNNDLFDLGNDERQEIARLLRELSAKLRPELPRLHEFVALRAWLDCLRAQAVVAKRMRATKPQLVQAPHLEMKEARHPLLFLKFEQEGRKVVPFTLDLRGRNRLLLLSGPNAGGKSIMLKGAGLLQVMVQSGMLVPCSETSVFGIFRTFCADIGDQQSLMDDLSTYSSHLRNMKDFLAVADEHAFMVIDEFGSGTDPKLGGAIAESILKELNKKQIWGIITTHYGNLKAFVYKQKGIVNGAMVFDVDNLEPSYELRVGKPGSSYAFEVASKAGLSPKLLAYAKTRVQGNEHEVDKLLLDLEREKLRAQEMADQLEAERKKLDQLTKTYGRMQKDLEVQRKVFKLETQERALQAEARQQRELEKVVKELREAEKANAAEAIKIVKERRDSRKKLETVVATLKEELNEVSAKSSSFEGPMEVGDHVRLKRGGATGEIESLDRGKAIVKMGELRMTANLKDLEIVGKDIRVVNGPRATRDLRHQEGGFKTEIDVRGFRREEVLQLIQDFIDRAMIENVSPLKILHGKGNGTLRKTVREKLREYKNVRTSHPPQNMGGDGVTIVEL